LIGGKCTRRRTANGGACGGKLVIKPDFAGHSKMLSMKSGHFLGKMKYCNISMYINNVNTDSV